MRGVKRGPSRRAGDALLARRTHLLPLLRACHQRGLVHTLVGTDHRRDAETLLELAPARRPAERRDADRGGGHLLLRLAEEAGSTVAHDLRHRASGPRDHRGATGERLDQCEAERLRPVDREEERERLSQELALLAIVDLAQELDEGMIERSEEHTSEL